MADNIIKVNTDLLYSDANKIADSIRIIEHNIAKLEYDFTVLDTMWDGPASEVFKIGAHNDIQLLKLFVSSLKRINTFEKVAKDGYNRCESEVGNIISSIK